MQIHWWTWPLLAAVLAPWLILRARPAWWTKIAIIRLGRVGPIVRAERREDEHATDHRATDYRVPPSGVGGPEMPVLKTGLTLPIEGVLIRAVGPSTALVKAQHARPRLGGGEILGMLSVEIVRGDDNTVYLDVRYAPPPGSTIILVAIIVLIIRSFGHLPVYLYALPLVFAWQLSRGYEQHRALVSSLGPRFAALLRTDPSEAEKLAWIWTVRTSETEASRHSERRKAKRKRAKSDTEESATDG